MLEPPAPSAPSARKPPIAIIGGGITGLSAAFRLIQRGHTVRLFEASPRLGGVIRSEITPDGWLIESGPNSFQENSPAIRALLAELSLADHERVVANPTAKKRFIVRAGRPVPVPMSPLALFATPLFSARAKLRLLSEFFARRRERPADVALSELVRDHFGQEIVDFALNPFVSGVYAGDADTLSARRAFPSLWEAERTHGSLIRGQIAAAKARRARGEPKPQIISFRRGLQALVDALALHLPASAVELSAPVENISFEKCHALRDGFSQPPTPTGSVWRVRWTRDHTAHSEDFSAVVLALPGHALARLSFGAASERPLASLESVNHPPVASLFLGFRRAQIAHPLDGFGALIPAAERRKLLGVLFSSTLFPHRAPADHVALTVLSGGTRQPELAALPTDRLLAEILPDLRALLGITGDPVFQRHNVWPRAIPQYDLGYERVLASIAACEQSYPHLFIGGQIRDGISLPACIQSGLNLADRAG